MEATSPRCDEEKRAHSDRVVCKLNEIKFVLSPSDEALQIVVQFLLSRKVCVSLNEEADKIVSVIVAVHFKSKTSVNDRLADQTEVSGRLKCRELNNERYEFLFDSAVVTVYEVEGKRDRAECG